jgi:hypothetical protein
VAAEGVNKESGMDQCSQACEANLLDQGIGETLGAQSYFCGSRVAAWRKSCHCDLLEVHDIRLAPSDLSDQSIDDTFVPVRG